MVMMTGDSGATTATALRSTTDGGITLTAPTELIATALTHGGEEITLTGGTARTGTTPDATILRIGITPDVTTLSGEMDLTGTTPTHGEEETTLRRAAATTQATQPTTLCLVETTMTTGGDTEERTEKRTGSLTMEVATTKTGEKDVATERERSTEAGGTSTTRATTLQTTPQLPLKKRLSSPTEHFLIFWRAVI